jgi:tetratricopeptide (TPR) repeat protein
MKAYSLYTQCVLKILGAAVKEGASCPTSFNDCQEDIDNNVKRAVSSCQLYVQCDQNNPLARDYLGHAFLDVGQYARAEEQFQEELRIGLDNQDDDTVGKAYSHMANVHWKQNAVGKAEKYLALAIETNKKVGDELYLSRNYKTRADIYYSRGNVIASESSFRSAISIQQRIGDSIGLGQSLMGLSYLQLRNGNKSKACVLMRQARSVFSERNFARGVADVDGSIFKNKC